MSGGERRLLGRWGEEQAAQFLRRRGFKLLEAGWQCRFGEIDLIATKGNYICFVEVKLRRDDRFAQAREFVDRRKQQRLRTSAQLYLAEYSSDLQPRFDVVEIYAPQGMNTARPEIVLLENAFE
ncbi:MAG: YraN family protein [Oscillospiraceae bacterium]|nr:YraN family protein [Oscillospiraceae bacterium]MBO5917717.1 YraN family protein [Oscillospiraceae bacterium]